MRIFFKECRGLAAAGYEVSLVVADGKGDESRDNVQIVDVGGRRSRLSRMVWRSRAVYRKAVDLDADIYHFHDPELIRVGRRLQRRGRRVVYDVHEDLPRQILAKHYLKPWLRPLLSRLAETYERRIARSFDFIVAATPTIEARFARGNPNVRSVCNYPKVEQSESVRMETSGRKEEVCYVGLISRARGIAELIDSLAGGEARLLLAGEFSPPELAREMERRPGWHRVTYVGYVDHEAVAAIYGVLWRGL